MKTTTISAALRSFAEEPWPHLGAPPPPTRLVLTPTFTIELSPVPSQSVTCCLRTSEEELDGTIAAVRATVREAGYTGNVWAVGPFSRPVGAAALLRARGFETVNRPPYEAALTVMALATAPPAPAAELALVCIGPALDECGDVGVRPRRRLAATDDAGLRDGLGSGGGRRERRDRGGEEDGGGTSLVSHAAMVLSGR